MLNENYEAVDADESARALRERHPDSTDPIVFVQSPRVRIGRANRA